MKSTVKVIVSVVFVHKDQNFNNILPTSLTIKSAVNRKQQVEEFYTRVTLTAAGANNLKINTVSYNTHTDTASC